MRLLRLPSLGLFQLALSGSFLCAIFSVFVLATAIVIRAGILVILFFIYLFNFMTINLVLFF